jgi:hypothetical protein
MSDTARTGWVLPVLLSVALAAALGFGFLYLTRPNAGELGAIRVVVTDESGKGENAIHVIIAEAPLAQNDTVSPGGAFTGVVHYPAPYLTRPNLKLSSGKRKYEVTAETELGFTWLARALPDDFREETRKDPAQLDKFLGAPLAFAASTGNLKSGLVFEEFTWEARGLRAPPSALPPKTFELQGKFQSVLGQEGVVNFEIPYSEPPHVELTGNYTTATVVAECTPNSFKWRNAAREKAAYVEGEVQWTAKGIRGGGKGK